MSFEEKKLTPENIRKFQKIAEAEPVRQPDQIRRRPSNHRDLETEWRYAVCV